MAQITITAQAHQQLADFAQEKGMPMKLATANDDGTFTIEVDDDVKSYLDAIHPNPSTAIYMAATGQVGRA